ncbi:DUF7521 family protein [Halapricum hydrolyticum]|uniref:Uncharacterized protein n=1 Tax=Halapricum hydrolyticum TaxID=2979991 RepID=A0AAE3LF96_9EURY|nr:hypothetical protein [Halapricum hydrolyticum]MCU4717945.1 hypothetical protein [Halapricum hydrolyticum]MCU4727110.1 hypothetical protein [Halapricum hydrolyticum]
MYGSTSLFVAAETVIFVCSGVLATLSYRAYQRRQSRSLGALFGGLTLVTLGALLGGVLIALGVGKTVHAASASAALVAAGFVIVTYSMYADSPSSLSA